VAGITDYFSTPVDRRLVTTPRFRRSRVSS
jgi:hypothetical protein